MSNTVSPYDCRRCSWKRWASALLLVLAMYPWQGPHRKYRVLYCFVTICCRGNVFTPPLLSNGRLFLFRYSGFQPSCHIASSLRLLVLRRIAISSYPRGRVCEVCDYLRERQELVKVKVKVTLRPTTSRSISPGFKAHEGLTTGYLFLLTRVLFYRLRAPPLTRGRVCHLSFIVIVRPLLVNIYRFTCNAHVSYKYTYI
jgi:hypothetical protein